MRISEIEEPGYPQYKLGGHTRGGRTVNTYDRIDYAGADPVRVGAWVRYEPTDLNSQPRLLVYAWDSNRDAPSRERKATLDANSTQTQILDWIKQNSLG